MTVKHWKLATALFCMSISRLQCFTMSEMASIGMSCDTVAIRLLDLMKAEKVNNWLRIKPVDPASKVTDSNMRSI